MRGCSTASGFQSGEISEKLKECSVVWIVSAINRASTDSGPWGILKHCIEELGPGGECKSINFICTKTDDINPAAYMSVTGTTGKSVQEQIDKFSIIKSDSASPESPILHHIQNFINTELDIMNALESGLKKSMELSLSKTSNIKLMVYRVNVSRVFVCEPCSVGSGLSAVMAILFAVVARGSTVLAKHACFTGNFLEVTEQILAKIPSENNKLTYSHGSYLFHYICHERIVYLCITDDEFERSRAFGFLNEVKKRFQTTYGSRAQTALPYAMNSEFSSTLAAQMKHHSDPKGSDRLTETQMHVDDLKGIMVRNIDLVAQRGERLELLIDKTENLMDSSVTFKTTSRNLAHAMCMKNMKLTVIVVIVVLVVLYFIVTAACGGLSWPSCRKQ
ncbi:hypothetical protein PO909_006554 [Leuciscus waleckii]